MNNIQPLLSICIPTNNRRIQLESLVNSIVTQPEFKTGWVEISISDNASTDGTLEYLDILGKHYAVIVNINKTNLGPVLNFQKAIENSSGKYVWLLGSDDLLADYCLKGIIETLEKESDCEYFMINNLYWFSGETFTQPYKFREIPNKLPRVEDYSHHRANKVSELISKRSDAFTPMYSSIMTRNHWLNAFKITEPHKHTFETINNCSFFAVYIAKNLFLKPGYYYGTPAVLASHTIGWEHYRALFAIQRLADLYDLWIKNSGNKSIVMKYKKELFGFTHKQMVIQLLRRETGGYQYFSFVKYLRQFYGIYSISDLFDIFKRCAFTDGVDYKLKFRIKLSRIKKYILKNISL